MLNKIRETRKGQVTLVALLYGLIVGGMAMAGLNTEVAQWLITGGFGVAGVTTGMQGWADKTQASK